MPGQFEESFHYLQWSCGPETRLSVEKSMFFMACFRALSCGIMILWRLRPPMHGEGEAPVKSYRVYRNGRAIGTTETMPASESCSDEWGIRETTCSNVAKDFGLETPTSSLHFLREHKCISMHSEVQFAYVLKRQEFVMFRFYAFLSTIQEVSVRRHQFVCLHRLRILCLGALHRVVRCGCDLDAEP